MGSVVKSKVGELENTTKEGRSRRISKEVVGCVHSVAENKKFLAQCKYGQKKEMSSSSLVYLSPEEEVNMDDPISHLPQKEQGELLTINGDPEVGEPWIF